MTMGNYFDQFDGDKPAGGGNFFDQFDESPAGAKPTATDYLKGAASGVGGLVSGIGYLAERAGADETGGNLRLAGDTAQNAFLKSMTPAGQRAVQSQVFEDDPGSALPKVGDRWGQALAMGAAQSAPSMLAAAIPGGIAAAGLRGAAGMAASRGIGGALAPLAAGTAAPIGGWATNLAGNLAARVPTALGFGAAEGAVAGASNAAQWKSDIEQKPLAELRKMPGFAALEAQIGEQAARQQIAEQGAADIMARTTLATGGIGALTGGGALGSAFQRVTTGAKGGILGAIGRDAAKEAGQELLQSGGERAVQNVATRDYLDPNQSAMQGVIADALSGAAIGGVMGGVTGGASHLAKGPLQKAVEASSATIPPDAGIAAGIPAGNAGNAGIPFSPQQQNTPAAPGLSPDPVPAAESSLPTNQAESAGVPISQQQEGAAPSGNETEITKPAATGQQAQPAAAADSAVEWDDFVRTEGADVGTRRLGLIGQQRKDAADFAELARAEAADLGPRRLGIAIAQRKAGIAQDAGIEAATGRVEAARQRQAQAARDEILDSLELTTTGNTVRRFGAALRAAGITDNRVSPAERERIARRVAARDTLIALEQPPQNELTLPERAKPRAAQPTMPRMDALRAKASQPGVRLVGDKLIDRHGRRLATLTPEEAKVLSRSGARQDAEWQKLVQDESRDAGIRRVGTAIEQQRAKRAASAEVAPQPAPAARKGIAAGLFQTPPQPTTGGGPLPQSATDMPVGKYGIAAAVAQPKAKAAAPFAAPPLTTRDQPKTTSVLPQKAAEMPVWRFGERAKPVADAPTAMSPKSVSGTSAAGQDAAPDTIQAHNGQPFKSQLAARRAASQQGVKDTHDVVPASEVSAGATGFVLRKRKADAAANLPATDEPQNNDVPRHISIAIGRIYYALHNTPNSTNTGFYPVDRDEVVKAVEEAKRIGVSIAHSPPISRLEGASEHWLISYGNREYVGYLSPSGRGMWKAYDKPASTAKADPIATAKKAKSDAPNVSPDISPDISASQQPKAAFKIPSGWTEASPGGIATNKDERTGGIVDVSADGTWFAVANAEGIPTLAGFKSRDDAFAALAAAVERNVRAGSPNASADISPDISPDTAASQQPKAPVVPASDAPPVEPTESDRRLAETRQRVSEFWLNTARPALDEYFAAFGAMGSDRLERNMVKPEGLSATDWLLRIMDQRSTWDRGRRTGKTGIQMLSQKDFWPGPEGQRLRKAMLAAIKALRVHGYVYDWIKSAEIGSGDVFAEGPDFAKANTQQPSAAQVQPDIGPDIAAPQTGDKARGSAKIGVAEKPKDRSKGAKIYADYDSLLAAIAKLGGMNTGELTRNGFDLEDITKKAAGRVSKKTGGISPGIRRPLSFGFGLPLHRKVGGLSFDGVLEALKQYGYFSDESSVNDVIDAVRGELRGDKHYTAGAVERTAEIDADWRNAELEAEQDRIDAEIRREEDAERAIYDDVGLDAEAEAAQDAVLFIGDEFDIDAPLANSDERAFLISTGLTEEEADAEINESRSKKHDRVGDGEAKTDATSTEGPGQGGGKRVQGGKDEGSGAGEIRPDIVLRGQTPEEVAAAEAEERARAEAEREAVAAEEAAKKAAEKQSLDDAIKKRAENPDNFQFGEDGKAAAKPMGGLFEQPSAEPSAQPTSRATSGSQPEAVPPAVLSRIRIALNRLREVERELAGVERARGRGHILALELRDKQAVIDAARAKIADFRVIASGRGIDADAVIAELGGEPDFGRFGEPAAAVEPTSNAGELPAWHTKLPTQGLPIEPVATKSLADTRYQRVPSILAADAYKAITTNQMMAGVDFYAHYLPAADGRDGIVRMLPEDQKPPVPWKILNGQALRPHIQSRQDIERKITEWLRSAPVIGDEKKAAAASKTPIVDAHNELMRAVRDGKASADQFKSSFATVVSSKDKIVAELGTKTKAQLLDELNGWRRQRYANETKAGVVDAVYSDLVSSYSLGNTISWGMGAGSYEAAVRKMVDATDDAKLAEYRAERQAAVDEAIASRKARLAALANPQTLDDFNSLMRGLIGKGQTFREAFLSLAPEQRIKYDELNAESTKEAREARKRAQKTEVQTAGQTTSGEIVATKHTKTGADLYVVRLADRLSNDDYRTVLAGAKKLGGWYSAFRGNGAVPGFQFKTKEDAEAFNKLVGGDAAAASDQVGLRRDAFADDRSQSAVERLREMADRIDGRAQEDLSRDRKVNTQRRARFAASAERAAEAEKALARTMRNIAGAIDAGKAKFLDAVRTKSQVEALTGYVRTAKDNELRAKYPEYGDREKRSGEPPTAETADFAEFPSFTAYRSDLASLARQMLEVEGTKKPGGQLMKVADDVTDAYLAFAKDPANLHKLSAFGISRGDEVKTAIFPNREAAERAIARSGLTGKAIVLAERRGVNRIILSPSEAVNRRIWDGDNDKRITLKAEFGNELVEAIGRRGNRQNKLTVPWQFQTAHDRRKALSRMGIETPAEFRSALREFIGLQERATSNKVREMELSMVGRKADGLDFFPTPQDVADQMVEAADITPEMAVLEPSAGMGHLADRIRAAGAEPDVIEISPDRRELLQEKGYNIQDVNNFLDMKPREFFTFGDIFRAPDGTEGVMRGSGGMGSGRVGLYSEAGELINWFNREELTGVRHRGLMSGYDRIIMNPPFSNRRDAEHVKHAYSLLRPGGRIVAIMGEGVFFGQDRKAQEFRDWLEEVGGTSEKLPEGSFLDPSLPTNTGVNARMVVIDKPGGTPTTGKAAGEPDAETRYNAAPDGPSISPSDRAIYEMANEGKSTDEILSFLSKASRRPFNRLLATALQKAGLQTTVTTDSQGGWQVGNRSYAQKYAAAYSPKSDKVALFTPRDAERHVLHELVHAATLRAIESGGVSAMRMRALFKHVQQSGKLDGQYGMSSLDEFVAEVFSNPKFRDALQGVPAPASSTLKSVWQWFVRIVARIVGIKTQAAETALDRALTVGAQLMQENVGLRGQDGQTRFSQGQPFDGRETATTPLKPGTKTLVVDGTERPALNSNGKPIHWSEEGARNFWRWFGESQAVDAQGRPLVVYHGRPEEFGEGISAFDNDYLGSSEGGANADAGHWLTEYPQEADTYTAGAGAVYPLYVGGDIRRYDWHKQLREWLANEDPEYLGLPENADDLTIEDIERVFNPDGDGMWSWMGDKIAEAKADGADGVLFDSVQDSVYRGMNLLPHAQVAVFDPDQIKSATGNRGTFDATDPDIRYNVETDDQFAATERKVGGRAAIRDFEAFDMEMRNKYGEKAYWKMSDGELEKHYALEAEAKQAKANLERARLAASQRKKKATETNVGDTKYVVVNGKRRTTLNSNGEPIEPTIEGVKAFWEWFGDSTHVDDSGRPIVLFHGTSNDFDSLEKGAVGRYREQPIGVWLTDTGHYAWWIAGKKGRVLEVYSRVNNVKAVSVLDEGRRMAADIGTDMPGDALDAQVLLAGSTGWDEYVADVSRDAEKEGFDAIKLEGFNDGRVADTTAYVVFDPNNLRIKSDATDPDIRYNIAADWQTAPTRAASTIRQYVADSMRSDSNTSWLTPFNTQYHKAEKWAAEGKVRFKQVFNIVQQFIADTSRFAVMSQNAAPALLHEIKSLRDVKEMLTAKHGSGKQHRADIEAIASPLYDGTLYGGGNPLAGLKWSDSLLRTKYNLTDRQIKLYHEALAAVKVSMDEMAKSLVAKHAKRVGVDFDNGMALDDMVADVAEKMKELQDDVHFEFLSDEAKESHEADILNLMDMDKTDEARKAKSEFVRKQKDAKEKIAEIEKTIADIKAIEGKAVALQEHGYFPLMRFGRHTVTAKDAEGKTLFFGMYDGVPLIPRSGQAEANRVKREVQAMFPDATVETGIINDEKHELYQGLNLDAMQIFAEHMDKDDLAPVQEFIRLATNSRSAMKRLMHREGTPGFDRDVRRTLAQFIVSNARSAASNYHNADMLRAAEEANKDGGDIGREAVRLVKYIQNPEEEAQVLRGFLFFQFLGGSIASAVVNLTQTPAMTLPFLWKFEPAGRLSRRLLSAAKMAVGDPKDIADVALRDALVTAEMDGVTAPQEIHQLVATAANNLFAGSRTATVFLRGWGAPFAMAESFNRRIAFISAFQIAQGMGKDLKAKTGFATPFEFAEDAVNITQGIYNKGNRMNVGRTAPGAVLMTFQQYKIMYLELLKRLPPKQRAIMLGVLLISAGGGGLPGVEDAEDIWDTIGQWLGFASNSKRTVRNTLTDWTNPEIADLAINGLLSKMGIDLHSRLGMQNLLPGTAMLKQSSTDKGREITEVFGPAASVIKSVGDALEKLATGQPAGAAKALVPGAIRNAWQGVEMAATGRAEDARGRATVPVNEAESIAKVIGFNPKSVAQRGEVNRGLWQDQRLIEVKREGFTADIVSAILAGDDEAKTEAYDAMRAWNEDNPQHRVTINPATIGKRVREARAEGTARMVRALPKAMRQQAAEEFAR